MKKILCQCGGIAVFEVAYFDPSAITQRVEWLCAKCHERKMTNEWVRMQEQAADEKTERGGGFDA